MFRKLTPFEHHKSFMPFDYLFMTKEQYQEFLNKTYPADAPVVVQVDQLGCAQPGFTGPETKSLDGVAELKSNTS
jgi:hypothetical protein